MGQAPKPAKSKRPKLKSCAAKLADGYVDAERRIRAAARTLHDHAGSQLAAVGLHLQMLRLDHPQLGQPGEDFARLLQGAMEQIRSLMVDLDPHPVGTTGLNSSLLQLTERFRRTFSVIVEVRYRTQTPVSRVVAEDIVWLSAQILQTASQAGAERIIITVSGSRKIRVQVEFKGRHKGAARAIEPVRHLAESAGFVFDLRVGNDTVITLHHAG